MRKAVRIHLECAPASRLRTAAPVGFGVHGCVEERPEDYIITAPFLLGQVVRRLASRHPNLKLTRMNSR